ncbi:hypothetical protein Tco_0180929 [Tanacetum coccineum]
MAQQQHAADIYPDEQCPSNKRYDLMDANKKVDLEQVQCLPESKILTNIIKNHPLRFNIAASSSVPWIYMAQFWHTLKEEGSKYRLRLEPRSDKESPKVEITNDKEVEITNVVIPVNVNEEEDEITDEVYKLKRREKGKIEQEKQVPDQVRDQVPVYVAKGLILERQKTKEEMERMIAKAILQERGNIQAEISSQIQKDIDN